ncbi:MAG: winged helix-turn-helix domain-containing protein [Candidatus Omnitrophica bacterium]|nr:winged helix-turn-helix domain-containing protein [Candidatus Omnitrophota bacterium]
MITEIGIIAGEIWHFLDKNDSASLQDLVSGLNKPRELILMSLGWLAREGHVLVECQNDSFKIRLRSKNGLAVKEEE